MAATLVRSSNVPPLSRSLNAPRDSSHQSWLSFGPYERLHWTEPGSTARAKSISRHKVFAPGGRGGVSETRLGRTGSRHSLHRLRLRPLNAYALSDRTTTSNSNQSESTPQQQPESPVPQEPYVESAPQNVPEWLAPLSRRQLILLASTAPLFNLQSAPASALESLPAGLTLPSWKGDNQSVQLVIGDGCDLGVSIYPDFEYNAGGKGGVGTARKEADGRVFVRFDPATLVIPPVQFGTTKLLTLPLPPPLKIEIVPKKLEGYLEPQSGKVELDFLAEFVFTIGPLYEAKPLVVGTTLTTESSQGPLRSGQGQRLDADGRCVLAGVARVAPVQDALLDPFLMLPTDCLAKLPAQFIFLS